MSDKNVPKLKDLLDERIALEQKIQAESEGMSERVAADYDRAYTRLQRGLAQIFRSAGDENERITVMLEMIRILENRLVYLHNFSVDPTSDNRVFAQHVREFIDTLSEKKSVVLTPLEATYYRAIASLYEGDAATAAAGFRAACESEESDEANDIKYKSYVILGNLSHEARDYVAARELHERSMQYSAHRNITAQALAFKALNSFALRDYDEALRLFEEALKLFDRAEPFYNSYFHRNSLLFCASIHFDRKEYDRAENYYNEVLGSVEPASYDYFDALAHLGKIHYVKGRYDDATRFFDDAIRTHKFSENEYLVDTYFWLARAHLKRNDRVAARTALEKIAASEVQYQKKSEAAALLQKVS